MLLRSHIKTKWLLTVIVLWMLITQAGIAQTNLLQKLRRRMQPVDQAQSSIMNAGIESPPEESVVIGIVEGLGTETITLNGNKGFVVLEPPVESLGDEAAIWTLTHYRGGGEEGKNDSVQGTLRQACAQALLFIPPQVLFGESKVGQIGIYLGYTPSGPLVLTFNFEKQQQFLFHGTSQYRVKPSTSDAFNTASILVNQGDPEELMKNGPALWKRLRNAAIDPIPIGMFDPLNAFYHRIQLIRALEQVRLLIDQTGMKINEKLVHESIEKLRAEIRDGTIFLTWKTLSKLYDEIMKGIRQITNRHGLRLIEAHLYFEKLMAQLVKRHEAAVVALRDIGLPLADSIQEAIILRERPIAYSAEAFQSPALFDQYTQITERSREAYLRHFRTFELPKR